MMKNFYLKLIITLIMSGSIVNAYAQLTCPSPDAFIKQKNKYKVPKNWCWAPNKADTQTCKRHIYVKRIYFSAAIWSSSIKSPTLQKKALCYYSGIKSHVLYSRETVKQPQGGNWKTSIIGYVCNANQVARCPFIQ